MAHYVLLFVVVALVNVNAEELPPEYQRCKHDDPKFSECMKDAVQTSLLKLENGISSLKVPTIQPLNVPSITIGEGKGAVNVVQKYKNYNLYDLSTGKIGNFNAKITDNEFSMEFDIDYEEVRFEADYSFNGRILLLPIIGDGKCTVKLQKLKAKFTLHAETTEKKGKKYLKVKNCTLALTPGKVIYNFENLFNGDERLGAEMNKVLNDNWKEVFDDIGDQYAVAIQTILGDYADKIFSRVPYDDLF
ncbi:hypothetical protein ILUMI_05363 [Ignelater luminosus]|uniref:Uncharacterized protein n=1 Tax=Ignelater luminosus TaxID=2038154 RepID=A0A8K0GI66_IGNLU|nr:hypothetical protein ILUMI_05363 [Ignelater luminosus]